MRSKFTTLLLISLMLALPLRAVAGIAMNGCSPNHHSAGSVSSEHSGAQTMQDISGCHEGKHAPSSSTDNCNHDHGTNDKHGAGTCSACGDCCVGALSIPTIALAVLTHQPASIAIAFVGRTYAGHHPEGPERPPRYTPA